LSVSKVNLLSLRCLTSSRLAISPSLSPRIPWLTGQLMWFTYTIECFNSLIDLVSCFGNKSCYLHHLIIFLLGHFSLDHLWSHGVSSLSQNRPLPLVLLEWLLSNIVVWILVLATLNLWSVGSGIEIRRRQHIDHIHGPVSLWSLIEILLTFSLLC